MLQGGTREMKIDQITNELGNDFFAVLVCEHCGEKQDLKRGYHDNYYHTKVMPSIKCRACGKDRLGRTEAA
jgi:phage terminase large subunit GpA-like protein